nr:MAG TPA: hypothetical protein [Bacteriophage sp.]
MSCSKSLLSYLRAFFVACINYIATNLRLSCAVAVMPANFLS